MAFMTNPGALFIGGLRADEKKYLKKILKTGQASGYKKLVEPCAGAFAMAQIGAEVGLDPKLMQASDVCLMSAVLGYAMMDKPLDDLEISHPTLKKDASYVDVLYHQLLLMRANTDGYSARNID